MEIGCTKSMCTMKRCSIGSTVYNNTVTALTGNLPLQYIAGFEIPSPVLPAVVHEVNSQSV